MIVVDASALVEVVRQTPTGVAVVQRLAAEELHAPHLIDAELAHALRRLTLAGVGSPAEALAALRASRRIPIRRYEHQDLLERVWELRANVTAYDAMYVALAERLGATLLTRDARLTAAPGIRAAVEVV